MKPRIELKMVKTDYIPPIEKRMRKKKYEPLIRDFILKNIPYVEVKHNLTTKEQLNNLLSKLRYLIALMDVNVVVRLRGNKLFLINVNKELGKEPEPIEKKEVYEEEIPEKVYVVEKGKTYCEKTRTWFADKDHEGKAHQLLFHSNEEKTND